VTAYSISETAWVLGFRGLVESPVEALAIVATNSQSPLICSHVNQLELPDELHDPLLSADVDPKWPEKIRQAVSGVVVKIYECSGDVAVQGRKL
jgi:hypothetical protein